MPSAATSARARGACREALPKLPEVTALVHDVGGLTVAAHLGDHGTEAQLRIFQDQGLDCVECVTPATRRRSSSG